VVYINVVVDVVDVRYVRDVRVRDIDLPEIVLADRIRRCINFAVAQRNPAQTISTSDSDANGHAKMGSAKESD
jgi:hypothetical protein